MNIYIQINNRDIYVEFEALLDSKSNQIGTAFTDYEAGKWVLLTTEQVAFHEAHPAAMVKEVFEMQLVTDPEQPVMPDSDPLAGARQQKVDEIVAQDKFSEKFFVSVLKYQRDENGVIKVDEAGEKLVYEVANYTLWMDRSLRASMAGLTLPAFQDRGVTTRTFRTISIPSQKVEVPISWAIDRIPRLEIYATETYDLFADNITSVEAATSLAEIAQIDAKANYPHFLTFELNIDLYEQA